MAKRRFELPGIQDLSKDQERARLLPKAGCHLIVGGPGTGKSVVALLRARRHHLDQDSKDYVFLVYNRLLHEASRQLIGKKLSSATWPSWFGKLYWRIFGEFTPKLNVENEWKIDWKLVQENIFAAKDKLPPPAPPYLIIDEGQDMPPEFYNSLANLGFENFFVVADQNQQITEQHSSRQDLENALAVDTDQVIELTENYRNSFPVARLAREFFTGDPAIPPPELPSPRLSAKQPLLIEFGGDCTLDFQQVIGRILKMWDRDPSRLIAVFTPNNVVRERYYHALFKCTVKLDNSKPRIITYVSGDSGDYSFSEGGIFVINAAACKGLEFDTVFLADIQEYQCNHTSQDATKKRFYVMVARAIERVLMLKEAGRHCPVEAILPQDENILGRWR